MGIAPLQFLPGQNADTLRLNGSEVYNISIPQNCRPRQKVKVEVKSY